MATYGLPMHSPQPRSNGGRDVKVWRVLPRLATLFAAFLGILVMSACSTTMNFGSMPRIDRLQTLTIGASNAGEVVRALGEPRGHGQSKFGPDLPEQQIWQYEYVQSDGRKVQLKMLLVFMDKDTYVGHMWFSSGQLVGAMK